MAEKPITVLLVDDREANRYAVCRILQKAHFVVHEAGNGTDALRMATEKPDLVILDINLPDMSGYEVCRRIKADPTTAAVPVMHLSASFVGSEHRAEGLEGGADGYLTYPLEPRELIATVQALLRVRQAEKEVRAQRELLHVTLSSIGDAVIATDASGAITFINPVAQTLTGWTSEEAIGRPLGDVFQSVNEQTGLPAENPVEKVLRNGATAGLANHTLLVARDGTRLPVENLASPIRDDERRFVGVVLVFRDISERRRLEREVQRRTESLAERDRRKDEFLAMLAHELRNPLAPIVNSLQILKEKYAGDAQAERLGILMERQVGNLVRLVDDLLDVARIMQGKVELRREPTSLAAVVARTVEAVQPFLNEKNHRLEVKVSDETLSLNADSTRLEQVLSNLLNNAAKYTPPGGNLRLVVSQEQGQAVLRVADDGIGIRPEMVAHIFDLFRQADRVPGRVSEGLGIGLTLVRQLVELHGGTVEARSDGPGKGSEFILRLPEGTRQPREVVPPTRADAAHPHGRSLRVLVIDDNIDAAETLALLLRVSGDHDVRTAHDGPAGLEVARAFRPEAIFLDIGLPKGMDGHEVARRLRLESGMESVLVVAMTGYGQPEDVQRALAAGMDNHITKPANLAEIRRLLAALQTPA